MKLLTLKFTLLVFTLLSTGTHKVIALDEINSIQQPPLAERFYDKLELNENLPMLTNQYINKKAAQRTYVPETLWTSVRNNIDYASFKTRVLQIIPNYYSNTELEELINLHLDRPHIPITKAAFRNELSLLISDFGKNEVLSDINAMLRDNNYRTFLED